MPPIEQYIKIFAKLRTDKNRARYPSITTHRAPHKPFLLLSVMDLIAQGQITQNFIEPSFELVDTFNRYYYSIMPSAAKTSMAYPFSGLQTDGFWQRITQPGYQPNIEYNVKYCIGRDFFMKSIVFFVLLIGSVLSLAACSSAGSDNVEATTTQTATNNEPSNGMMGMGINGVTGDYSRGASGFRIEKGELTTPISEATVAGNLKQMFLNLTPADDLVFKYAVNAPTLRIDGMTLAGN